MVKSKKKITFGDVQSAAVNNSESEFIFNEIKTEINNIDSDLIGAFDEIQKLHEVWQNELII
uniref:Uncharacterized protein n=1 Tax=uncultured microorganism TaxID=358574 RepID=I2FJG8_9ZZZZ|nr:hypothetical protein [uncultured microorganism]